MLDDSENMSPVTTTTQAPFKVTVDPFGGVSTIFNILGGTVKSTGQGMANFLLNPFGIFGANAEKKPKDSMFTCIDNMINQSANVVALTGDAIKTCTITFSSSLQMLGGGATEVAKSLQNNVVLSWFKTGCSAETSFQQCLQTVSRGIRSSVRWVHTNSFFTP